MHRHGYQGRKFHREVGPRRALLKGLADSLIEHGTIQTTLPKAKELVPYAEKLITKAKKGDLASRRHVIAQVQTVANAHKLVDDIAPKLKGRVSGHLRIEPVGYRRGDHAALARVSFVDDVGSAVATEAPKTATAKKSPAAAGEKGEKSGEPVVAERTASQETSLRDHAKAASNVQAPKRTGRRGDR
jgi:large subunit ribosomal protein L17